MRDVHYNSHSNFQVRIAPVDTFPKFLLEILLVGNSSYMEASSLSSMECLPVELLREIMAAISDIASLKMAVLSCPALYRAFSGDENAITKHVLENRFGIDTLPEAVAALDSSTLRPDSTDPWAREEIVYFVERHLHQRKLPTRPWTLATALPVGRLSFFVRRFAEKFAKAALAKEPVCRSSLTLLTQDELWRIERTFYRFEIYCNLFRESGRGASSVDGEQKPLFLANFSPWENEQLGCVHDFLAKEILPGTYSVQLVTIFPSLKVY